MPKPEVYGEKSYQSGTPQEVYQRDLLRGGIRVGSRQSYNHCGSPVII